MAAVPLIVARLCKPALQGIIANVPATILLCWQSQISHRYLNQAVELGQKTTNLYQMTIEDGAASSSNELELIASVVATSRSA
jgi:hypothetical protein